MLKTGLEQSHTYRLCAYFILKFQFHFVPTRIPYSDVNMRV